MSTLDPRPSFDETFMAMAVILARRGDCTRRQVAAIIVLENHIVGHGYNGVAPGAPGCLTAGACPRGKLSHDDLPKGAPYGSGPGRCIATHAEVNAIIDAKRDLRGATCYVTTEPCHECANVLRRVGITRVVTSDVPDALRRAGIAMMEVTL